MVGSCCENVLLKPDPATESLWMIVQQPCDLSFNMAHATLPDHENRFSEYTSTNHQPLLWILTSLSLAYSVVFLLIRIFLKQTGRGIDDAVLAGAYVRV